MSNTTSTTLNDLLPSIVAEALFIASERSIMRGLVRNYTLPMGSGKTITVPRYPIQSAAAVSEGTDLTNTAVSTDGAVLTVSEVGIMATITDYARMTSASNVIADVGRLLGEAVARKIDTDLTGLFDSFTTALGDGTTQITAARIFEAVARLRSNGVPTTDMYCVLHPSVSYDLLANLSNTYQNPNAGVIQNEAMQMGFVGMLAGIPVYQTSNMANSGNAGDFKGAVFHRDALGLAMLQDIRIETQRDASLRADELVCTAVYGVGELVDAYGVEMHFDSSIL